MLPVVGSSTPMPNATGKRWVPRRDRNLWHVSSRGHVDFDAWRRRRRHERPVAGTTRSANAPSRRNASPNARASTTPPKVAAKVRRVSNAVRSRARLTWMPDRRRRPTHFVITPRASNASARHRQASLRSSIGRTTAEPLGLISPARTGPSSAQPDEPTSAAKDQDVEGCPGLRYLRHCRFTPWLPAGRPTILPRSPVAPAGRPDTVAAS